MGVMKYCRHILVGNEIFSKTFDGPKNIFLCSILLCCIFLCSIIFRNFLFLFLS